MYNRINYTIVGIFVVVFGMGMIWFAFWLGKYGLKDEYDTYRIELSESVSGLSKDATVKMRGVDIGRVKAIRINPKNIEIVEVLVDIKKGIPIKEDMTAHTQMYGITGILSIEIDGGTNDAKNLKPTKDYIPLIPSTESYISKLSGGLGTISERLAVVLAKADKLLSDKNLKSIENTLDNVEKITARGEDVEKQIEQTLDELRASMKRITVSFEGATKDFTSIKERVNPTVEKLFATTKDFQRVTVKVEKSLDRGDYNLRKILEPAMIDIQILSSQINDLAQELKQSPSDVLFKARKERRGPGE
ncbi:MAG: MCE family protein [Campylobacterales bacterium]|nr:MCE family protein [Campylobacterales bacterium]